jgi:DNA-binding IclR family transcriptional regulator
MKSPSTKILDILRESLPRPLTYKVIAHYLLRLGYRKKQIHNSLSKLRRLKLISADGRKKSKRYLITPEGLKCIHRIEVKKEIKELEDYLLIIAGGID